MATKLHNPTPGLVERGGIWRIDKVIAGKRICISLRTRSRAEAEVRFFQTLARLTAPRVHFERPAHTFREAATRYLEEALEAGQASIHVSATYLEQADPFIGDLLVSHIDDEALKPFVQWMLSSTATPSGRPRRLSSHRTVNIALQRIARVLSCCHKQYRDDVGARRMPWLDAVPSITMLDERKTRRAAYPLSWDEQRILFDALPDYLRAMAAFKVNTGCREQEVCKLRWEWELYVPQIARSVFIIPADFGGRSARAGVKNREDRVVIMNDEAARVIEAQRGKHPELVFPYRGRALHRMNSSAWKSALDVAATQWEQRYHSPANRHFRSLRVHDLKHTFGVRLKEAGVGFEDRQALLGHKNGSVTTHYSGAQVHALIEQSNRVLALERSGEESPTLATLRLRRVA